MGRGSASSGVSPAGDRIQIRFLWRGRELRPTLSLKPTEANLRHARRLRASILEEIKAGTFKLSEYFPDYRFAHKIEPESNAKTFREWAKLWGNLSARSLEDSSLRIYKRHLNTYWLSVFGDDYPQAITHERILQRLADLAKGWFDERTGKKHVPLARKTQNNIMIPLRGVFELICRSNAQLRDPTEGIDNLKVQRAMPDPFDMDEVEAILAAIATLEGKEAADYFEFSFFAGLRASEQIALLWPDVDLRSKSVMVRRARVLSKDKERTKTTVSREVELNARAYAVIKRQRKRTQLAQDHVFRNTRTGLPWNDEQTQRRIWTIALRKAGIRYRAPKECRDTSVTLALQAGASPLWVATQHGHSLAVMMRDYAKWIPGADLGRNIDAVNQAISRKKAATETVFEKQKAQ